MEEIIPDTTDWYSSSVREGVYDFKNCRISELFKEWRGRRIGGVLVERKVDYSVTVRFEKQEDLVEYILAFEEMSKNNMPFDPAMFYAPYIPPLTADNYSGFPPAISFDATVYKPIFSKMLVYRTS